MPAPMIVQSVSVATSESMRAVSPVQFVLKFSAASSRLAGTYPVANISGRSTRLPAVGLASKIIFFARARFSDLWPLALSNWTK